MFGTAENCEFNHELLIRNVIGYQEHGFEASRACWPLRYPTAEIFVDSSILVRNTSGANALNGLNVYLGDLCIAAPSDDFSIWRTSLDRSFV